MMADAVGIELLPCSQFELRGFAVAVEAKSGGWSVVAVYPKYDAARNHAMRANYRGRWKVVPFVSRASAGRGIIWDDGTLELAGDM